ncbi:MULTISPECIES: FHA domain-containing protein [unclassified Motilimonas]|uniref:type VI secretion system-associated FHA domain protein n=1 Tax=Motilimonas TaxID=1914248 RepID=UPI001E33D5AA|nr:MULTISPECIES: FHA domain-containing protein [unclassified Motilimonas]MCE0557531.1 FHA domain-containing protein [Motilimonas sp. E26]MDO6524585.1 FHA domain-containing protein [Motilimonas sp. 1_MG-2023]
MTLSIHLIKVPAEETLSARVVHLPANGGTIGRSPDANVFLPDHSQMISRLHAEISLHNGGYQLIDKSTNATLINDKKILKGRPYLLNDGDVIQVVNYTMLVSTLNSAPTVAPTQAEESDPFSHPFALDLADDDIDFLEQVDANPDASNNTEQHLFSAQGVFSDDPFNSDPFADFSQDEMPDEAYLAPDTASDNITSSQKENNAEPASQQYFPIQGAEQDNLSERVDQLLSLTEENQRFLQNPQLQHQMLFEVLEETLDQFLDEFSPSHLESLFADFVSGGLFSNKEKKYWRIYRSHFNKRQNKGDYRRQFKALFMENMQKQGMKK